MTGSLNNVFEMTKKYQKPNDFEDHIMRQFKSQDKDKILRVYGDELWEDMKDHYDSFEYQFPSIRHYLEWTEDLVILDKMYISRVVLK